MPTPPTKPTTFPTWATGLSAPADIAEPDAPRKVLGFDVPNQKPPRKWVNWLFRRIGEWLEYFDETLTSFRAPVLDSVADGIESLAVGEPYLVRETVEGVDATWSNVVGTGSNGVNAATDGLRVYVSTASYTAALDPRTGDRLFDFEAVSAGIIPGGRCIATDGEVVVYSDGTPGSAFAQRSLACFAATEPPATPVNGDGFPFHNPLWTYNHGHTTPGGCIYDAAVSGGLVFAVGGRSDGAATTPTNHNFIVLNVADGSLVFSEDLFGAHSETRIAVVNRRGSVFDVYVSTDDADGFGYDLWQFGGHVRRYEFDAAGPTLTLRASNGSGERGPWNAVTSLVATREALFVGTEPCLEYYLDLRNLHPDDDAAGPNTIDIESNGFAIASWANSGATDPVTVENVLRDLIASWAALAAGGSYYAKSWQLIADGTTLVLRKVRKAGVAPDPDPLTIAIAHPLDSGVALYRGFNLFRLDARTLTESWRVSASTGFGADGAHQDLSGGGFSDGDGRLQTTTALTAVNGLVVACVNNPANDRCVLAFDAATGAVCDAWSATTTGGATGVASDGLACYVTNGVTFGSGDPSVHRIGFDIRPTWFVVRDPAKAGYRTGLRAEPME